MFLKRLFLAAGLLATSATIPLAQSDLLISHYNTWITAQDMRNSNGTPLTDLCAMIQQDRANYHRFGRPDRHDGFDHFFGNAEVRARIPSMCQVDPGLANYVRNSVRSQQPMYLRVDIYGRGNAVSRIYVQAGAG